jgi:beta-ring hydroxylase
MSAGRPVWRWLWWQEVEWEKVAKDRMPEASGDVREIIGQPVFIPLQTLYRRYGGVRAPHV